MKLTEKLKSLFESERELTIKSIFNYFKRSGDAAKIRRKRTITLAKGSTLFSAVRKAMPDIVGEHGGNVNLEDMPDNQIIKMGKIIRANRE